MICFTQVVQRYKCDACNSSFSSFDVAYLVDMASGQFTCDKCAHRPALRPVTSGPASDLLNQRERLQELRRLEGRLSACLAEATLDAQLACLQGWEAPCYGELIEYVRMQARQQADKAAKEKEAEAAKARQSVTLAAAGTVTSLGAVVLPASVMAPLGSSAGGAAGGAVAMPGGGPLAAAAGPSGLSAPAGPKSASLPPWMMSKGAAGQAGAHGGAAPPPSDAAAYEEYRRQEYHRAVARQLAALQEQQKLKEAALGVSTSAAACATATAAAAAASSSVVKPELGVAVAAAPGPSGLHKVEPQPATAAGAAASGWVQVSAPVGGAALTGVKRGGPEVVEGVQADKRAKLEPVVAVAEEDEEEVEWEDT